MYWRQEDKCSAGIRPAKPATLFSLYSKYDTVFTTVYSTHWFTVQSIVEYSTLYSEVFVNNVLEATRKAFLRN